MLLQVGSIDGRLFACCELPKVINFKIEDVVVGSFGKDVNLNGLIECSYG